MTILEDAMEELSAEVGEEMIHYPQAEPVDSGDDFWKEDGGWDRENGTKIEGFVEIIEGDAEVDRDGVSENADAAVRTSFGEVDDGDLLVFAGDEWVVTSIKKHRISGRDISHLLGVVKHT